MVRPELAGKKRETLDGSQHHDFSCGSWGQTRVQVYHKHFHLPKEKLATEALFATCPMQGKAHDVPEDSLRLRAVKSVSGTGKAAKGRGAWQRTATSGYTSWWRTQVRDVTTRCGCFGPRTWQRSFSDRMAYEKKDGHHKMSQGVLSMIQQWMSILDKLVKRPFEQALDGCWPVLRCICTEQIRRQLRDLKMNRGEALLLTPACAAEGSRLFFEGASSMNYIPSTPMPAVHMGARMNRRTTMRITILGLKLPSRCILR
eukprot:s227_g26.t2